MKENAKDIYTNRAMFIKGKDGVQDCTDFECCSENLVFAMKDNYHAFSIGLTTILECLAVAEKEGYVPRLPDAWWVQVS